MEVNQGSKAKMNMKDAMLICGKLYISESRNRSAIEAIERAARLDPEAAMVNKFEDRAYNRVRYTLVSYVIRDSINCTAYSPMRVTLRTMVEAAYATINLEMHSGAHPRLGVVDHICFHPLARASLEDAAQIAKLVASDIGNDFQVPVFLYEAAHPRGRALDSIRRELGYFRPNMGNQWAGWGLPEILTDEPDEGPARVSRERGITIIGASPWVENYNVPVRTTNVPAARRIARAISARGGGLPTVQALALVHGDDTTEIACILLDANRVGCDKVQNQIELIAAQEGLEVEKGYFTDISQDMIVDRYIQSN
ncbi:formimidoyltransferase-cyclodeaminase-like [Dioscorea cayenensis subsp. rotundata]|uniref:Formimidoyltransferase-cyclodeaminase-like n=1 Tax=Dioscorea cayennensis subsp. rotundata TaxID=55577 RepID=A0AB40BV79_DIOCR|nr:formimidoyltransferase-cyclodeaminase-like [Dioscorea cayenensis subsp. rotundata]XP_039130761.1 formimidoyltransferase-cyclodeaminase-like [Dioscorea cayenensis subsp. rotundata]